MNKLGMSLGYSQTMRRLEDMSKTTPFERVAAYLRAGVSGAYIVDNVNGQFVRVFLFYMRARFHF